MTIDQQHWDELVLQTPGASFLQSWGWGELQRELGYTFWRLQETDGVALVIKRELRFKHNWLYSPRGPIAATPATQALLLDQLLALGATEQSFFVRSETAEALSKPWRPGIAVQPTTTLVLDLTQTEPALLAAMHQKTRYNIKVASRQGVTVRFSHDSDDIEHFIRLATDVSERSSFQYHPAEYYRTLMRVLDHHGAELALAEHNGAVLAAHILMNYGGVTTYIHGASSSTQRSLMAPHLLQWESIKRAQQSMSTQYDFYGIAPPSAGDEHPWAGITRFKRGFGGVVLTYPGAYDRVLKSRPYRLYRLLH